MLFREAADPEAVAVLDRMLAQVTAVVAALIAAEPGAQKLPQGKAEREQGIHLIAQMLVGAVQTVANWWADHPEVSREHLVETAMGFAWLGLDRLSHGERWTRAVNFARDVVDAADRARPALLALARERRAPGDHVRRGRRPLGAAGGRARRPRCRARRRGDDAGRQPPRVGLRDGRRLAPRRGGPAVHRAAAAGDLRARMDAVEPRAVVADERDAEAIAAAGFGGPVLAIPDERLFDGASPPRRPSSAPRTPALIVFTSGTSGEPKPIRHGQRYLGGQASRPSTGSAPGRATSAGARRPAAGRSRRATSSSRRGCAAPPRCSTTRRFDPDERLELSSARA